MKTKSKFAFIAIILTVSVLSSRVQSQAIPEQLTTHAQEPLFNAFAGLDLPNEIRIEGAMSDAVDIIKLEGPGNFTNENHRWYWHYTPPIAYVGQIYTVKFLAKIKNADVPMKCEGTFDISIHQLEPLVSEVCSPSEEQYITPYTGVHFTINGKYKGLDGYYKISVCADGKPYMECNEPFASFVPVLSKDEGKELDIKIFYRSFQSMDYVLLDSASATIKPPPLAISAPVKIRAGEVLKITAFYGIEGDYTLPAVTYLEVESDGYFMPKALNIRQSKKSSLGGFGAFDEDLKGSGYDKILKEQDSTGKATFQFILKPTEKMQAPKSKEGHPIKVIFVDPVTNQRVAKTFIVQSDT